MTVPLHRAPRGWSHLASLCALALFACACGASPVPQPPVDAIPASGIAVRMPAPTESGQPILTGRPGSAPPDTVVLLTVLDSSDAPLMTLTAADGSFAFGLPIVPPAEMRLELLSSAGRSAPTDVMLDDVNGTWSLMPSLRFDCITLTPGFTLPIVGPGSAALSIASSCSDPVTVTNARTRLGASRYAVTTALPVEASAETPAVIDVSASGNAATLPVDVLFLDLTLSGQTIRYPVTLSAAP